jgi:transglutaminase-like putative cysteine protease
MVIFTLKREWDARGLSGTAMPKNILGGTFFIGTVGLTTASIVITLSIFFLIPRMEMGFFDRKTFNIIKMAGFSEEVKLGSIGSIKEDRTIVMRVELADFDTPPPSIYFRGITLDHYDGYRWKRTIKDRTTLEKDKHGLFSIKSSKKTGLLKQNILLEPIDTDVIFTAFRGIAVEGRFPSIMADTAGSFYMRTPSFSRFGYTAYSILPESMKNRSYNSIDNATFITDDPNIILNKPGNYDSVLKNYLQLPEGSDRLKGLLQGLVDKDKPSLLKAKAIESYLKKNYRYTLNPKHKDGIEPLEDFLFFSKEGYCEQFATAMAMLLRAAGIPSRVVTGFLSGEWNRFGNYLIVRQIDAHSWVETYLPGAGWVLFDPTPQAGTIIELQTPTFLLYLDSLKWKWHRYIVNYSFSDQIRLTRKIHFQTNAMFNRLKETFRMHTIPEFERYRVHYMILILIITLLTLSLIRTLKRKNTRRNHKTPDFYLKMMDMLKKKGFVRKLSETPFEFAKRCSSPAVLDITIIYTKIRFGNSGLTPGVLKEVKNRLQIVKAGLK